MQIAYLWGLIAPLFMADLLLGATGFSYSKDFIPDPNVSISRSDTWVSGGIHLPVVLPVEPRTKESYGGGGHWTSGDTLSETFGGIDFLPYGLAHTVVNVWWEDDSPVFHTWNYSKTLAQGVHYNEQDIDAHADAYGNLTGIATLTILPDDERPWGLPIMVRPVWYMLPGQHEIIGWGTGGSGGMTYNTIRVGPNGSGIHEVLWGRVGGRYWLAQVGDTFQMPFERITESRSAAWGNTTAMFWSLAESRLEVDMNDPVVEKFEIQYGRIFAPPAGGGDVDAVLAMMLDHWAAVPGGEPALWRSTVEEYSTDLRAGIGGSPLTSVSSQLQAMNAYLKNHGTDLRAVLVSEYDTEWAFVNSVMRTSPHPIAGSFAIFDPQNVYNILAVRIVLADGYYGADIPGDEQHGWISVRDPMDTGLRTYVDGDDYDDGTGSKFVGFKRSFRLNERLWCPTWDLGPDPEDYLLDNEGRGWVFLHAMMIAPADKLPMLSRYTMSLPWEALALDGMVRLETEGSASAEVEGWDGGDGRLHIVSDACSPADVLFTCYFTDDITLSFDYALTAGTELEVRLGNLLVDTLKGDGTIEPLHHYERKLNLAALGLGDSVGDVVLRLKASGNSELFLDNLLVINPEAIPLGDLNNDYKVDFRDFAVLAGQWQLEKLSWDVAPNGGDGTVNFVDFVVLANSWQGPQDMPNLADFAQQWLQHRAYSADIAPIPDGDGKVDTLDLAAFCENWLAGL